MTEIPLFIRVRTTEPLEKRDAVSWYHGVKALLPSGVLSSVQTTNPQGDPDVVFMVHKETKAGEHLYEIPLTRDLTVDEVSPIEEAFSGYKVETSSKHIETTRQGPADAVVMEEDQYNQLCETLAKHQHQRWYEERSKAGWSFGLKHDESNRRHPMMRPWEQLPDEYRKIDYEMPHLFMSLLVEQGYVVVGRVDLNKWLEDR